MQIGHFVWLRALKAKYDLASSGVLPIDIDSIRPEISGDLSDVLSSLYQVKKENIAITYGAQEANFAALAALKSVGVAEAITFVPEYEPIRLLPQFLGMRQAVLELTYENIVGAVKQNSLLFLSSPNNPTGLFLSERQLWELSDELRRKNAYAVIDSIFMEFVTDNLSGLPLERIVYTSSTSKFYTTPEFKVGWIVGDERIVQRATEVIDLVSPLNFRLGVRYASYLLRNRAVFRERNISLIRERLPALSALKLYGDVLYTEYMPVLYFKPLCNISGTELAYRLLNKGIAVVPGRYFGVDNGVRVGLASVPYSEFREAMSLFVEVLEETCREQNAGGGI